MSRRYSETLGHRTSLYAYGAQDLRGESIALCPGGGNSLFVLEEMVRRGVRTLITGVTIDNDHSRGAHDFAKAHGINLLGGTHYSTEKFAPMKMCEYFLSLGLPAGFVHDSPDLYDL